VINNTLGQATSFSELKFQLDEILSITQMKIFVQAY